MSEQWKYQLRLSLSDEFAQAARDNSDLSELKPLMDVLDKHNAELVCQFDAFADYVFAAEKNGVEHYPLYEWTKSVVNNTAKEAKYIKEFTLYVEGDEVYAKDKADALETDLQALVGGEVITKMAKHDTNPANNPQPPKQG